MRPPAQYTDRKLPLGYPDYHKKRSCYRKNEITYSNNLSWQQLSRKLRLPELTASSTRWKLTRIMKPAPCRWFWRISDESFEKVKEWQDKYGSSIKYNDPVVYGRDWIYDGKDKYGYRIYDPVKTMVKNSAFSQNHNISLNGKRNNTNYSLSLGYLGQAE
jgi:hypothetical protein